MENFKYAVMDIGANSVRMNIYDIDTSNGRFTVIDSARHTLGLASYAVNGALSADGAGKLTAVMRDFLARANSIPCDRFSAFATASLRGLSNSSEIVSSIKQRFGVDIEIISGRREAEYDFKAIRSRFGDAMYKNGVIIDMGGGSTEMITFSEGHSKELTSMPLGCVMLGKKFIPDIKKSLFPDETEIKNIREYTKNILFENTLFCGKGENLYLIGGTGRAIARLHSEINGADVKNTDGYTFDTSDISDIITFALKDAAYGGSVIKRMMPDRLTTIIPGLVAYDEIFRFLSSKRATVCASGVREGYLLDFIEKNFSQKFQEF
ncbi:MAG: hypothetical protein ACI4QR_07065 [Eubacteriales bacterium]